MILKPLPLLLKEYSYILAHASNMQIKKYGYGQTTFNQRVTGASVG
jgi:hypothetical protein